MSTDPILRDEVDIAIRARAEVGHEMEPAVIDAFVARIEGRLAQAAERQERAVELKRAHQRELVLGAMGISIPLFTIAAIFTGLAGIAAVCAVLAVIALGVRPLAPARPTAAGYALSLPRNTSSPGNVWWRTRSLDGDVNTTRSTSAARASR